MSKVLTVNQLEADEQYLARHRETGEVYSVLAHLNDGKVWLLIVPIDLGVTLDDVGSVQDFDYIKEISLKALFEMLAKEEQ